MWPETRDKRGKAINIPLSITQHLLVNLAYHPDEMNNQPDELPTVYPTDGFAATDADLSELYTGNTNVFSLPSVFERK